MLRTSKTLHFFLTSCLVATAVSACVVEAQDDGSDRFADSDGNQLPGDEQGDQGTGGEADEQDSDGSEPDDEGTPDSEDPTEQSEGSENSEESEQSEESEDSENSGDDEDCTLTQGYWKNHNKYKTNKNQAKPWPIDEDTDLCGQTWLDILLTPTHGDAWYILGHQWIAASLNDASGAIPNADVQHALDRGKELLEGCAIDAADRAEAIELSELLDAFNNGHTDSDCEEDDDDDTSTDEDDSDDTTEDTEETDSTDDDTGTLPG